MKQYLLIFLIILSFIQCSPLRNYKSSGNSAGISPVISFQDDFKLLYKGSIDIMGKHFSGIFVFRKAPEHETGYISFLSEVGLEFIRFRKTENDLELVQVADVLNKKAIIETFSSFLKLLVFAPVSNDSENLSFFTNFEEKLVISEKYKRKTMRVFTVNNEMLVERVDVFNRFRKQSQILLQYSNDEFPSTITYTRQRVNLTIELNRF